MAAMIEVIPVDSPAWQREFLQLPYQLYRGDACWIAASESVAADLAGFGDHAFYQHADSQAFVALANDQPIGRIVAIDHDLYRRWHREHVGYFGFFECANDPTAAAALLGAAGEWLAKRGCHRIRGPFNPSANYSCGCLVQGYESRPSIGMPYNPPFCPALIERAGFAKARDLLTFVATRETLRQLDPRFIDTARRARQLLGIDVRPFDMNCFDEDIRSYFGIFNRTIPHHWGAAPVSEAEIRQFASTYRPLTVECFTAIAERDGTPVGAVYGFPDFNAARQSPAVGKSHDRNCCTTAGRGTIQRLRIAVAIVLPQYHLWGVGPLMNLSILENGLSDSQWSESIQEVEYSWILENNWLSRRTLERGGARLAKVHRIYEKPLPATPPDHPT
jgi:hypothetical protein